MRTAGRTGLEGEGMTEGEKEFGFDSSEACASEESGVTRQRTEEQRPQRARLLSQEFSVERADARSDAGESDGGGVRRHAAPRS